MQNPDHNKSDAELAPLPPTALALIEGKTYAEWVYDHIAPYIKGRVLELGSGAGSIASTFIAHSLAMHLSDPNKVFRDLLRTKFMDALFIKSIKNVDYNRADFNQQYIRMSGVFDTVVALNIHDQGCFYKSAIQKGTFLLRKRGHLMLVAPAPTAFLNESEQNMEDYKKYNIRALQNLLSGEYEILKARYFTYVHGLEEGPSKHVGLSVLAILRKY